VLSVSASLIKTILFISFITSLFNYPDILPADKLREKVFNNVYFNVLDIEAECQDDYMKIRVAFNGSFTGLLYSSGYSYDRDCVYINGTGRDYYEFFIQLNRCGTLGKNAQEDNRKSSAINVRCIP